MKSGVFKTLVLILSVLWLGCVQAQDDISEAEMALGYYQPLAEQGEPYAQLTIGEIYMEGAGVEQDLVQAYAWFAVSSHQGVDAATELMKHVLGKLSADQQQMAKVLAGQFIQYFSPQ